MNSTVINVNGRLAQKLETLGTADQIAGLGDTLHAVEAVVNELAQGGFLDFDKMISDNSELQMDMGGLGDCAGEIKNHFSDHYGQITETWGGFAEELRDSEWAPVGEDAEVFRSDLAEASSDADLLISGLDEMNGREVRYRYVMAGSVPAYANGGILARPQIALVGEAGPESAVPLSQAKRDRGIELWQETGEILGVWPDLPSGDGNAVSFPAVSNQVGDFMRFGDETDVEAGLLTGISISPDASPGSERQPSRDLDIQVDVASNPGYTVRKSGGVGAEDILSLFKNRRRELAGEIADGVGGELAGRLETVYENIPLKGAG